MQSPQFVYYREGQRRFLALVTAERDDGRVNLSVFTTDGTCVGRTGIPVGEGPGQCSPIGAESTSSFPFPVERIEQEFVRLQGLLAELQAHVEVLDKALAKLQGATPLLNVESSPPSTPGIE